MFEGRNQSIYDLLNGRGLIPQDQLDALREELRVSGRSLADAVVAAGHITSNDLLSVIASALGYGRADELIETPSPSLLATVTADLARTYGIVPTSISPTRIEVVAVDPFNVRIVEDLTFVLGRDVSILVAEPSRVMELIKRYYGEDETSVDELLRQLETTSDAERIEQLSVDDLEAMAGQAPVIRLVNLMLGKAIKDHASDVHFEPFEHEFKVRCRVDGALFEMSPPPKTLALPITSRIKVLANLNIAERRVPQDGRMKLTISGRPVDLRVSTLPTQFGESVVLRVLDQTAVQLSLDDLGLPDRINAGVKEIVRRPNGIFMVTGPTGCGKTTTLYSALRLINTPDLKVLTAEDPVEYEIDGIVQVPVNPGFGLTFSATLRSFLRQDPDVIMVGEIRDLETAQIAVQASLTGHLVLSTLHTNDAAGAVTRLVDMGIEPFLIASSLEAVLAQRLVRRICRHCIGPADMSSADALGLAADTTGTRSLFRGCGCAQCSHTGYRGRTGIYEWLPLTESLRELVISRAPTLLIRRLAMEQGMQTLRESGVEKVLAGATTVEEVIRCT